MGCRLLLIGLDGFDPVLARRFMGEKRLPVLSDIAAGGVFKPMRSTVPPFTYPAWSTCLTGVNPGQHGIVDFAERIPGTYRVRFVNATYRKVPSIFTWLSDLGSRVGAMGFPGTYPPEPVNGFMISGFDSPLAVHADASFCYPRSLYHMLRREVAPFTLAGIQEVRIGKRWHRRAASRMLEILEKRTQIALHLLENDAYDLFGVVFSEPDTASHHFWSFFDPQSPRRSAVAHMPERDVLEGFIPEIYRRVDDAVGRLRDKAGSKHSVVIVSDHGFGGTGARRISLNRMLEKGGFFTFKGKSDTGGKTDIFPRLVRLMPVTLQEIMFRHAGKVVSHLESDRRLASADLPNCLAFSDELNYFPSIWLHDQRFPSGHYMSENEKNRILDDISCYLTSFRDPSSGEPIVRKVHRRETLYHGPCVHLFPDLILELSLDNGYAYTLHRATGPGEVVTPLPVEELLGRKGGSMNGSHRPLGVFFADGPEVRSVQLTTIPSLTDVMPTLLAMLGKPAPPHLDGRILDEILLVPSEKIMKIKTKPHLPDRIDFTPKENKTIENRLKNLGYL